MKMKQLLSLIHQATPRLLQPTQAGAAPGLAVRTGVRAGDILSTSPDFYDALKDLGVNFVVRDLPQPIQP